MLYSIRVVTKESDLIAMLKILPREKKAITLTTRILIDCGKGAHT